VDEFDVDLRGVTKSFGGRRAVDDVTLQIRRGELFSLLGPSGCGKTTLMRLVAGFESADAGTILLGGSDMAGVPPHRRDVNMVFQNYALFPHLSVAGNIAFGLRIQKAPGIEDRVRRALEKVGLPSYEDRAPATLSGGEQQRVALARAIVTGPRVLLLDEPLAALDLKLRKGLQEELRRLQRELGMTILFVTHDQEEARALAVEPEVLLLDEPFGALDARVRQELRRWLRRLHDEIHVTSIFVTHDQEEALEVADRIAVMNRGRIEQVGTPEEIYERPATRFTAEFVGTGNFFEGTGDGRVVRTNDGLSIESAALGKVTLLVRPEKMRLNGGPGIDARVEEVLYQGSSTSILLRTGGRRLLVEDANDGAIARVRVGETASLSWRPEDVRILPR
jgi:spermidine/putrescine transport system ATP-binding protein